MIKNGYKETKRKIVGGYEGGTITVWRITTPSGNIYEVSKNSKNRFAYITDKDNFKILGAEESYQTALKQIYYWEDNGIRVLPDLTNTSDIKNILNQYHGIVNAVSLIQDGCIKPDLQTAVYLFATNKDKYSKHNWVNLDLILKIINLNEEDVITLCKYTIAEDIDCVKAIPSNLLVKMTKKGKAKEQLTPDVSKINPLWLTEPSYGEKVKTNLLYEENLENENDNYERE